MVCQKNLKVLSFSILKLCYLSKSLEKVLKAHVRFVFVNLTKDNVYAFLVIQFFFFSKTLRNDLSINHHFVEFIWLQIVHVESITKAWVVIKDFFKLSFDIINIIKVMSRFLMKVSIYKFFLIDRVWSCLLYKFNGLLFLGSIIILIGLLRVISLNIRPFECRWKLILRTEWLLKLMSLGR